MTLAQAYLKTERDYFEELREHTFARAIADGMEIITPTDNQISLDIDRQWPHETAYLAKLLNLRRVLCGAEDPIALFRPKTSVPAKEDNRS